MARTCPQCQAEMMSEIHRGVCVDVCPVCEGIWFDPDELRALLKQGVDTLKEVDHAPSVPHGAGGIGRLMCPDDHVRLQEYHYMYSTPAILETCPTCGGFFVAQSELAKISDAYRAAHAPLTAKEQALGALIQIEAQSDAAVLRARNTTDMFNALQHDAPGWLGLF